MHDLPKSDEAHIGQDIGRAFTALAAEWLDYVQHLKSHYPYLFSLVLRTHPLQENPSATVTAASEPKSRLTKTRDRPFDGLAQAQCWWTSCPPRCFLLVATAVCLPLSNRRQDGAPLLDFRT